MIAYILYRAKIDLGFIKYIIVLFIQEEQFFFFRKSIYTHICLFSSSSRLNLSYTEIFKVPYDII
jgi:hypothetical protein